MEEDGESRMAPGAPGTVCSLVEKAPGDGKQNLHSEHQNTPNPPPFSH